MQSGGVYAGLSAAALLLMVPGAVAAQPASEKLCTANIVALPPGLESWADRIKVTASATPPGFTVTVGHAVDAMLHPAAELHYAVPPNKPDEATDFGGMLQFDVTEAGTYRVALGTGAWIDVLAGRMSVPSIAHAREPDCSTIHKMVDFRLASGSYVLQLSAARAAIMPVMIVRLP